MTISTSERRNRLRGAMGDVETAYDSLGSDNSALDANGWAATRKEPPCRG
jgi:hypothetical protein